MIDKSLWSDEELEIFKKYNYKCVHCVHQDAVALHELKPKSLNMDWRRPENRLPLCSECHDWAHKRGTRYSRDILIGDAERYLGERDKVSRR